MKRLCRLAVLLMGLTGLLLGACADTPDLGEVGQMTSTESGPTAPVDDVTPTQPNFSGSVPTPSDTSSPETSQPAPTAADERPTLLYVRADGNDGNSGRDQSTALGTVQEAVNRFRTGGTIDIGPGVFAVASVQAVVASEELPLVLRGAGADQTWLSSNSYDDDAGIEVVDSAHVVIENVGVRTSLWGIAISGSQHVTVRNTELVDLGQEALSVREFSSFVTIVDNVVHNTGQRPGSDRDGIPYARYGEGIYIGTGSGSAKDSVNNIVIRGNDISATTSEAIDLKPFTYDLLVENNLIHDLATNTSGALVLGVGSDVYRNPNAVIRNNQIWNISRTSQFRDGNGIVLGASAEVYNNAIWSTQHRGIFIDASFANVEERSVLVHHNTVVDTGGPAIEVEQGQLAAQATVVDNIGTSIDGNVEATADLFVDWAASDYRLASGAAAVIDASSGQRVPESDIAGTQRPQGSAADIGAFEYVPTS